MSLSKFYILLAFLNMPRPKNKTGGLLLKQYTLGNTKKVNDEIR